MAERIVDHHESKALQIVTLAVKASDGVQLFRQAPLGDEAALTQAERELEEMLTLHEADVSRSWEILVQRTIDELREEVARPAHPRCIEHDCSVRILHVSGTAEGQTVTAAALLDGSPEDFGRRLELMRSVALMVLDERGVTVANHGYLYDDMGFEQKTRA